MPETNLVFFDTEGTGMTAYAFAGNLRKEGVLVSTSGEYRARAENVAMTRSRLCERRSRRPNKSLPAA